MELGMDGELYYVGTLDLFAKDWNDKFVFYPRLKDDSRNIDGTIFVTPYNTLGAR